jgi:Adenylate and Guanylate cyclase catalytic domain
MVLTRWRTDPGRVLLWGGHPVVRHLRELLDGSGSALALGIPLLEKRARDASPVRAIKVVIPPKSTRKMPVHRGVGFNCDRSLPATASMTPSLFVEFDFEALRRARFGFSVARIQRSMAEQNTAVPQDQGIEFRIGIHVGDVIFDDNDIFGDGVNIAARLEGIAEPGGVCMSDDAYRQVRGKVEIACDDMGLSRKDRMTSDTMSASLIGHLGSSAFRLSTTAVSMSLTGSCFSSEEAPRPFHHGIRRRGGTIFGAALPSYRQ